MEDLSLHILDIAENSIRADAKLIQIHIERDLQKDLLFVEVVDDGKGMDADTVARIRDPFFTTKRKKTGLGIPLLAQAAEQAEGYLTIDSSDSSPGSGTKVVAVFRWTHVDRPAVGNIADTIMAVIAGHPEIDLLYEEREGDRIFRFDTREIKCDLEDIPINAPEVLKAIRGLMMGQLIFER